MMRDNYTEKDSQALANWEKWMKERKEVCARIGKAIGTEPPCLLMNRERNWEINRQKDVIYDAQQIKEYECRCGKTGCPLFWKTTEPRLLGSKNLLAEVFFSPLKLTHENKKLSHLIEDGYIGLPNLIKEEKGVLGQKCLENALKRFKDSPYYKQKIMELEREIEEVEYVPNVDDLIIVGKTIVQEEKVEGDYTLPGIIVEDYRIIHQIPDEKMAILSIGKLLVKGNDTKGINWTIEFTGVYTSEHHAKYIKFTNRGQIAISYIWKENDNYKNLKLPLRITKAMMTRFFFNKSEGILLPGQSFYQSFWFQSRTPGIFKEIWSLETKPILPPILFFLEGMVSMSSNKEKHKNNEINNYLERLVKETEVRESAEMALHRIPSFHVDEMDHANKFTEKEIFMHNNPLLYYHDDVIHKVKKLHERFFKEEEWNLSMTDLSKKLVEHLQDEPQSVKDKVFKFYSRLLRRLQKKPVIMDMLESDWEMFKYHMTYLLLCTAIAEMEKCLNYQSWGLKPPNAPPGPEEEYEGNFTEKRKNWNLDEPMEEKKESDTEEDEEKLSKIENEMIKEFGDDALSKTQTINLHLGLGVRFVKDDMTREEQEIDEIEEECETEEEEEEHTEGEEKHAYLFEEAEEEELYEEEMSEEEISLSSFMSQDKSNNAENEEESEADHFHEEGTEEEDEEEEEEEEEEELEEEEDDDEDELSIEEEEEINEEQEMEYVESITEKIKFLLTLPANKSSTKKSGTDAHKKKEPASKPPSKQSGKEELKQQKQVIKDQEPNIEKPKNNVYDGGDPAPYLRPREEPPPWVRKHFLLFAKIQWRQILEDTIDDIAVLIESINFHKGATPRTDIKYSDRAHYPC